MNNCSGVDIPNVGDAIIKLRNYPHVSEMPFSDIVKMQNDSINAAYLLEAQAGRIARLAEVVNQGKRIVFRYSELSDKLTAKVRAQAETIEQAEAAHEKAIKERDAAVHDLYVLWECGGDACLICKYYQTRDRYGDCLPMRSSADEKCKFEWRGVCDDNTQSATDTNVGGKHGRDTNVRTTKKGMSEDETQTAIRTNR